MVESGTTGAAVIEDEAGLVEDEADSVEEVAQVEMEVEVEEREAFTIPADPPAVEEAEPARASASLDVDVAAMAARDLEEAEVTVEEEVGPEAEIAALTRAWEAGRHDRGTAFKLADLASTTGDAHLEARWLAELGEMALEQGKWAEAQSFYTRALDLDPGQALALRRVARLSRLTGDEPAEAAEATPEAVSAVEPEPPVMAVESMAGENGNSAGLVGDADVAQVIGHFREAISEQLSATDHASHYDLGMTYFEMDLIDEAVPEFQKALGGISVRRQCLELLAACYSRLGSPDRAAAHERAAMAADQGDGGEVELRYELACCLAAAGHLEDARAVLRQVLTQAPEYGDARERLAALEAV